MGLHGGFVVLMCVFFGLCLMGNFWNLCLWAVALVLILM
jgi:hypothetical protein